MSLNEYKLKRRCPKCGEKEVGSHYFAKAGEHEYDRTLGYLSHWPRAEFLWKTLAALQSDGFLTKESGDNYRAVSGMKVNVVER